MSQSGKYGASGLIKTLSGASGGGLVGPDAAGNIHFAVASALVSITGTPASNLVTFDVSDGIAASVETDAGTATPVSNTLQLVGGTGINTAGAGDQVTVNINSPVTVPNGGTGNSSLTQYGVLVGDAASSVNVTAAGTDGQVMVAATGADPAFATLTSSASTIAFTPGANSLNVDIAAPVSVAYGGTGNVSLTNNGVLIGAGTSAVTVTSAGTNGQVLIGSSGGDPDFASLTSNDGTLAFTAGSNALDLSLSTDFTATGIDPWHGSILETASVSASSDGATITFSVEQDGGGDLTAVFSDGFYDWDTTPADTVTLTAGTDTAPQLNYVYLLQSTKALTASTAGWPAGEHAPLATVLCQSAASLQTDGPYKLHAWTDHVSGTNEMGHISHLNFWIRQQDATYVSGVTPTLTITPNGGAADNVIFTSTSGTVLQLHEQTFPAFAGTPDVYTVNDNATPYNKVTDLNALLTDSTGASMSGRYFSLVIWGVVSQDTADCKLMVNLPSGSYNTQTGVEDDAQGYADYSIPADFTGTGFLIAEYKLRHQAAASGTWTEIEEIDLRGTVPGTAAGGGGGAAATEFDDSVFRIFDDGDDSKKIAFQASGITASTTRTLTVQDADGTIAYLSDITGGITWNEETGTSATMAVDNGYIANNAGLVTLTLPDTAALGSVIRVVGKGAGGWRIAQNAGESINFGSSTTTTGVGGYLEFTDANDAVELVCITADTTWSVISSVGNLTVV